MFYVRKIPANESLTKPYQYFAIEPKRTPYYNPAKPEDALTEARRAIEINPDSFLPWFFSGEIALRLGRLAESKQALTEALRRAPRHYASMYNLGIIAYEEKQYSEAERWFLQARNSEMNDNMQARICYLLAVTISKVPGRTQEALRWAQQALRHQPGWKDAEELIRELGQGSGANEPAPLSR
jgi:tetratricopeptide (TPR) repeat protein